MEWYVYYHNWNQNKIEIYNIFDHYRFRHDVELGLRQYDIKEEFAEDLKAELMYYFWSKAEWEIIIKPWCGGGDYEGIKIDVYDQAMLNWDVFVDYCWSFKEAIEEE